MRLIYSDGMVIVKIFSVNPTAEFSHTPKEKQCLFKYAICAIQYLRLIFPTFFNCNEIFTKYLLSKHPTPSKFMQNQWCFVSNCREHQTGGDRLIKLKCAKFPVKFVERWKENIIKRLKYQFPVESWTSSCVNN